MDVYYVGLNGVEGPMDVELASDKALAFLERSRSISLVNIKRIIVFGNLTILGAFVSHYPEIPLDCELIVGRSEGYNVVAGILPCNPLPDEQFVNMIQHRIESRFGRLG